MEQRSPEWFEARKNRITASMVGAILGLSPHMTRAQAMRRMVRDALGAPSEFDGNIATQHGTMHEDGAKAEFIMETGLKVYGVGFLSLEDWAGCSPDGIIIDGDDNPVAGLEIKCPFSKRKDADPEFKALADQPHYEAQVQFSMAVSGLPRWYFWQWAPGGTRLEIVDASPEWQAQNMPLLRQFHAQFLDELKAPGEHLSDARVEIDGIEAKRMVDEYDDLTEALERAKERRDEVMAALVRMAGERNALICGRKLTKTEKKGAVSYAKALAHYAPNADVEPFRGKPSSSWGLR